MTRPQSRREEKAKKVKWYKRKKGNQEEEEEGRVNEIKVGALPRNEAKIVFITLPMSTFSCFHRRHDFLLQSDP